MIKYCESVECRHGIISEFFSETRPVCASMCDVCFDEESVRRMVDRNISEEDQEVDRNNLEKKLELTKIIQKIMRK